ncbi:MAG: multiheme c-type cytochrome [Verrucomicrobiia bacterium]
MLPPRMMICLVLAAACTVATVARADDEDKESDRCVLCHEQETKDWQASPHSQTMNDIFLNEWTNEGKKWECLVCHTSQFDRQTGKFSHDGISCQSCHGTMKEDHPDKSKMALPVTSEVCQGCHAITYGEWRVSAHGQKNIRCFDCHKMHEMKLRKDDPDQMCGTCHTERLKDFSHATHSIEGLHCLSCHMPEVKGVGMKIRGLGVRGHTFGVGAETCANCHRDMVHASHERATLNEEVKQLKAATPEKLKEQLDQLETEGAKMKEELQANRRVFPPVVGLSFLLGIFLGVALPHFRRKKQGGPPK